MLSDPPATPLAGVAMRADSRCEELLGLSSKSQVTSSEKVLMKNSWTTEQDLTFLGNGL